MQPRCYAAPRARGRLHRRKDGPLGTRRDREGRWRTCAAGPLCSAVCFGRALRRDLPADGRRGDLRGTGRHASGLKVERKLEVVEHVDPGAGSVDGPLTRLRQGTARTVRPKLGAGQDADGVRAPVRVPSTPPLNTIYRNESVVSVDSVSNLSPRLRGLPDGNRRCAATGARRSVRSAPVVRRARHDASRYPRTSVIRPADKARDRSHVPILAQRRANRTVNGT